MDYNVPGDKTLYIFAKGFEISCGVFDEDEQSVWFFQPNILGTYTITVFVNMSDSQLRIGLAYGPPIEPAPGVYEEWGDMEEILFEGCADI